MTGGILRALALGALFLPAAAGAVLAPPPNDNFAAATPMAGNTAAVAGTTVDTTKETGEPAHAGLNGTHSAWWTWTAPATGDATIDTNGSAFDTVLAVYTGSAVNALTLVAADDDSGTGLQSLVAFAATAGTAYRIAVDGFSAGGMGSVTLTLLNSPFAYACDFDSGLQGWTVEPGAGGAAWAADATPASFPSGVSRSGASLNFNNGADYSGGTSGAVVSPPLNVSGIANPVIEFWCNYNTETRGTQFDRRTLQLWNASFSTKLAEWQMASVGYSFNATGGLVGIGPGPCGEAYVDLETGTPVAAWHQHRIFLSPAWGTIHVRFVFWSVDDQRNQYAGWAVDDLVVKANGAPAFTGWPDNTPDTQTSDGDGNELDTCDRQGNLLRWSWGCSNLGTPGVHMIIGDHPQAILDASYMFYDPNHGHVHLSQYSDFSLWQDVPGVGFRKVRRGPKRSFFLTDIDNVVAGAPQFPGGSSGTVQAISYGWQDVYGIGTLGQEINIAGVPNGTYWLVGVIDPLDRLRETNNMNQTDQIRFDLTSADGQVNVTRPPNPFPPTAAPLTIASASIQGPQVRVLGTGFDVTLVPVLYDAIMGVTEAPLYTLVSTGEILVDIPSSFGAPAAIDLIRPSGHAASYRMGSAAPVPNPQPLDPFPGPLTVSPATGLSSSGPAGGAFAPASATYTLSNAGSAPLLWSAWKGESWVSATPSGGSIPAGGNVTVTVSINGGANALASGGYSDTVGFSNASNGTGSQTRPVGLAVAGPASQLEVTPAGALVSVGDPGGPFSPTGVTYTVRNTGAGSIDWTAAKTQSWVTLSPTGGALAAGATATVTVSINSGANGLGVGTFSDTVTLTNTTNGSGNTPRSVTLRITAAAPPTLSIAAPPATATSSPFVVTGTASGGTIVEVAWTNATTGDSGTATGTANWSASIPLVDGPNAITITAFDANGNSAAQTFTVNATLSGGGPPPVGGGSSGGGCGLSGLEALVVLALARRRKP